MDKFESLLDRLEKIIEYLEFADPSQMKRSSGTRGAHPSSNGHLTNDSFLIEYDKLISGPVKEFSVISSKIGGDIDEHCRLLLACFSSQRRFLELTAHHSKPSESDLEKLTQGCFESIAMVEEFREKRRGSPNFNQISALADSVVALKWIIVSPSPAPFVKNMQEAAEFFTNRVIKEYKDSNPDQVTWAKALISIWTNLVEYIKEQFPGGITWNAKGSPATAEVSSSIPPPPPPRPFKHSESPSKGPSGDPNPTGALFAQLNRGEAVTAGLRKVTDDMKTHKNPNLRAAPPVEPPSNAGHSTKPEGAASKRAPQEKPAAMNLNGNKWVVENFRNQNLQITETKPKHAVYINNCEGCTIEVKGKINSIMLDACKKTGVVFDHLISSLDVVNCQSVQVQSLGQLQTVNVDKTDGCQIYLSRDSANSEVITSKSSAINILIPKADDDFVEYPVPEQFKTVFTDKGLETIPNTGI